MQSDFLAYGLNGDDLGSNGFARLVVGNDVKQGRWVSNVVSLEIYHAQAVPETETWALVGTDLLMMGLRSFNRRGQSKFRMNQADGSHTAAQASTSARKAKSV